MECLYITITLGKKRKKYDELEMNGFLQTIIEFFISIRCYWFSVAEHTDDVETTENGHNGR